MPWDRKRLLGYVETIQLILGVTDKIAQQFLCHVKTIGLQRNHIRRTGTTSDRLRQKRHCNTTLRQYRYIRTSHLRNQFSSETVAARTITWTYNPRISAQAEKLFRSDWCKIRTSLHVRWFEPLLWRGIYVKLRNQRQYGSLNEWRHDL